MRVKWASAAGLLIRIFYLNKSFFSFDGFGTAYNQDTDPNPLMRFVKNVGRNIKATGLWFLLGIALTALYQRYVPAEWVSGLFGRNEGFDVLIAATIGVPLYMCGGGTISLLQEWLLVGMSMGSTGAFMITGQATKITNLGAIKTVLGGKHFLLYILFSMGFALVTGLVVDLGLI